MASLRQTPNCKYWIACVTLPSGKRTQRSTRIPVKGTTRKETRENRIDAQRWAEDLENATRRKKSAERFLAILSEIEGESTVPARVSVREYRSIWLKRVRPELAQATYEAYRSRINRFIEYLGTRADHKLHLIAQSEILKFREAESVRVSPSTVNAAIKTVRRFFSAAKRDGYVSQNPAESVDSVREEKIVERRPFEDSELALILRAADDEWRSMIYFGFYTGQRLGDIAVLTWQNIDAEKGLISLVTRKTKRRQNLPIPPALAMHIATLPAGDDPKQPLHPRAYATLEKHGRTGALSRQFYEVMAAAGVVAERKHKAKSEKANDRRELHEISFHSLRHMTTSSLKNAGVSAPVAQEFVGHDSESINRVYTHIDEKTLREAAGKLPNILVETTRDV